MNSYALTGLVNGLASTTLGLWIFSRSPQNPKHRAYGMLCLSLSLWSYSYCAWQLAESREIALVSVRLLMAGAILIPLFYLQHVLTIIERVEQHRMALYIGYALSGFFLLSDLTPLFVTDLQPEMSFQYWPKPGPIFHFFLIWFFAYVCYATYLLAVEFQNAKGIRRNQYLYLMIGSVIGYGGGATNFPLWYGIQIPPDGTILVAVYAAVFAYTIVRYRLMDITVVMHKGLTYGPCLGGDTLPIYSGCADQ